MSKTNTNLLHHAIDEFSINKKIFSSLLNGVSENIFRWKESPGKWCLLEIACHLYDEESQDFRTRLFSVLRDPEKAFPPINPIGWVSKRKYIEQDFDNKLADFLSERDNSIKLLKGLTSPKWDNTFQHPQIGPMSAKMILSNWLAHDYLHIRQIIRIKFAYLKHISDEDLKYAGSW